MTMQLTEKESQALIWSMGLTPMLVGVLTLVTAWILTYLNS